MTLTRSVGASGIAPFPLISGAELVEYDFRNWTQVWPFTPPLSRMGLQLTEVR